MKGVPIFGGFEMSPRNRNRCCPGNRNRVRKLSPTNRSLNVQYEAGAAHEATQGKSRPIRVQGVSRALSSEYRRRRSAQAIARPPL